MAVGERIEVADDAAPRASCRCGQSANQPYCVRSEPTGAGPCVRLRLAEKLDLCIGVAYRPRRPAPAPRAFLRLLDADSKLLAHSPGSHR